MSDAITEANELGTVESGLAEAGAARTSNVLAEAEQARFIEKFDLAPEEPEIFTMGSH